MLALLGLPGFGLALAITTVSTFLPVVASAFVGSSAVIGLLIGAEGVLALFVPLVAGSWSDRLETSIGGRLPFVLASAPVLAVALVVLGLAGSLPLAVLAVVVFFVAYFVAYEPYRALYPDLVEDEVAGRAQSGQAAARGIGTAVALGMGGLLLGVGDVVPFAVAAVVVVVAIGLFSHFALTKRLFEGEDGGSNRSGFDGAWRDIRELVREHTVLRPFMVANALWEFSLAAIKTFVVLYITRGLGYSLPTSSAIIGATALVILVAALASGRLADRYGTIRVMRFALLVYGIGLLIPFSFDTAWVIVAGLPFIAFGGGVLMALPYALLMPVMPQGEHGVVTGFYSMSRGVGIMLGPLLAGAAIDAGLTPVQDASGYPAVWGVAAVAILLSLPFLRAVGSRTENRRTDA